MRVASSLSRRSFLRYGAAITVGFGSGNLVGRKIFADRTQLASRIDDAPAEHPLLPALRLGADSLAALEAVKDYTATFHKQELLGRRTATSKMEIKLRHDPFSVYLKFIAPHAGREVIYVEGANNGNLLVHDVGLAGLVGTLTLDPTGKMAMDENRYPVTMIGMRTMVETVMEQWLGETKLSGATVNYYPNAKIGSTTCKAVESSYHQSQPGVKFQLTRLYVDAEKGWPIRVQQYAFPAKRNAQAALVEDYLYADVKANVGLTAIDFDPRNPRYGF